MPTERNVTEELRTSDLKFDGSGNLNVNVQAGGGGGGSVSVTNFPAEYPLPASQVTTLKPPTSVSVSNMIPAVETGLAKDATLTGGNQKTKIVDSAGHEAGVTNGRLDTNVSGVGIDVNDQTMWLIRRLLDLLAPLSTQDSSNRQKIVIDAQLPTGANTIGAVSLAAGTTVATLSNLALIANVDPRYGMIDVARNAYANGTRANLSFY